MRPNGMRSASSGNSTSTSFAPSTTRVEGPGDRELTRSHVDGRPAPGRTTTLGPANLWSHERTSPYTILDGNNRLTDTPGSRGAHDFAFRCTLDSARRPVFGTCPIPTIDLVRAPR
jgi:hypothetical protein